MPGHCGLSALLVHSQHVVGATRPGQAAVVIGVAGIPPGAAVDHANLTAHVTDTGIRAHGRVVRLLGNIPRGAFRLQRGAGRDIPSSHHRHHEEGD